MINGMHVSYFLPHVFWNKEHGATNNWDIAGVLRFQIRYSKIIGENDI